MGIETGTPVSRRQQTQSSVCLAETNLGLGRNSGPAGLNAERATYSVSRSAPPKLHERSFITQQLCTNEPQYPLDQRSLRHRLVNKSYTIVTSWYSKTSEPAPDVPARGAPKGPVASEH